MRRQYFLAAKKIEIQIHFEKAMAEKVSTLVSYFHLVNVTPKSYFTYLLVKFTSLPQRVCARIVTHGCNSN